MATKQKEIIKICQGPSKYDLQAALFDEKHVTFTIGYKGKRKKKVKVLVRSVEVEGGSLNSWNIKGYIFMPHPSPTCTAFPEPFEAYWRTQDRSGYFKLELSVINAIMSG